MADVKALADQLVNLTVKEVKELADILDFQDRCHALPLPNFAASFLTHPSTPSGMKRMTTTTQRKAKTEIRVIRSAFIY